MRVVFSSIGQVGIITDMPDWQLPPFAWTRADNIRFLDGAAWKIGGFQRIVDPPTIAPHFAMPVLYGANAWWLYAGLQKVYAVLAGVHSNITRQTTGVDVNYIGSVADRWGGTLLSTVPILNNGIDLPQMWLPIGAGTRLQALSNWPATATAKVIRAFKSYLVALNITKSGVNYPSLVKWSHPADPGTVPTSWDDLNPAVDANEYPLNTVGEGLIDALEMGRDLIIYDERGCHVMSYIGGQYVFRLEPLKVEVGMLAQSCGLALAGRHFVVTTNDLVLHDGQNVEPIADSRVKRQIFTELSPDNYRNSFVLGNKDSKEIWFCYPERLSGSVYPTRAAIWSVRQNTFSFRDLGGFREGGYGRIPVTGVDDWASDAQAWSADNSPWSDAISGIGRGMLLPDPTGTHLQMLERTYQADGGNIESVLERTAMKFPVEGPEAAGLNSIRTAKQITNIFPHVEGVFGQVINITLGMAEKVEGPVTWGAPFPFVIGQDNKVDAFIAGQLPAIRFSSNDSGTWKLTGYEADVRVVGSF